MDEHTQAPAPRRRHIGRGSGQRWRILTYRKSGGPLVLSNKGVFDELVLDRWFHLERMARREWWMRVGDAELYVTLLKEGKVEVRVVRGAHAEVRGETSFHETGDVTPPPG